MYTHTGATALPKVTCQTLSLNGRLMGQYRGQRVKQVASAKIRLKEGRSDGGRQSNEMGFTDKGRHG